MATHVKNGQYTVTATATALTTAEEVTRLVLISLQSNAEVYVGNSSLATTNGAWLLPGKELVQTNVDLANVYIIGTAGNKISWIANYGTA